ncbi:MAG: T9SS type A sorting domain-containing protein [Flavobacteriales bacterium]|nr:T9SS type A sorting domain-containing protein [Flavobacteriales bacterium]
MYDCPNPCTGGTCKAQAPLDRTDAQGVGGYALTVDGTHLFLGGGGGTSWSDNEHGAEDEHPIFSEANGVHGGVIYIIQAAHVEGNNNTIYADGLDHVREFIFQANGGGGAGGTIFIDATTANNLNLSAKGGYGGNTVLDLSSSSYQSYSCNAEIGPGGGGGGGVIIAPTSTGASSYNVSGGAAGMYYEYNGCNSYCPGGTAAGGPYPGPMDNDIPIGATPGSPTNLPFYYTNWCAENGADGVIETPLTVNVNDNSISETAIYSNGNEISIQTTGQFEVTIYSTLGQQVYQNNLTGASTINPNLHGVYLVTVESNGASVTKKVHLN